MKIKTTAELLLVTADLVTNTLPHHFKVSHYGKNKRRVHFTHNLDQKSFVVEALSNDSQAKCKVTDVNVIELLTCVGSVWVRPLTLDDRL